MESREGASQNRRSWISAIEDSQPDDIEIFLQEEHGQNLRR